MTRYLVTPSLYDSWRYYMLIESKKKQDFLNNLLKIPESDPEALARMKQGVDFEKAVQIMCHYGIDNVPFEPQHNEQYKNCVKEVADIVRGGLWQERVMIEGHKICGIDVLLYGKMDVIKRDWIYDIKRSKTYDLGKYEGSIQHSLYMVGAKIKKFKYLISDDEIVYHEDYYLTKDMENTMFSNIAAMMDSIMSDADFKKAYLENWQAFGENAGNISRYLSA